MRLQRLAPLIGLVHQLRLKGLCQQSRDVGSVWVVDPRGLKARQDGRILTLKIPRLFGELNRFKDLWVRLNRRRQTGVKDLAC